MHGLLVNLRQHEPPPTYLLELAIARQVAQRFLYGLELLPELPLQLDLPAVHARYIAHSSVNKT